MLFLSDLLKAKEKGNKYLTAVMNCSGALSRAKRGTMGKKIWLPMHP